MLAFMMRFGRKVLGDLLFYTLCLLLVTDLNFLAVAGTYLVNVMTISESKTAVFVSGWDDHWGLSCKTLARGVTFACYFPITLRQNLRGFHTDWYLNPSALEILDGLADPTYKNAVFVGHGSFDTFSSCDGGISSYDILNRGIARKEGELVQHTCGTSKYDLPWIRDVLLENPNRGYYFEELVDYEVNAFRAFTELGKEILRQLKRVGR